MDWRASLFSREKRTALHTLLAIILSLAVLLAGQPVSGFIGNFGVSVFYFPFYKLKHTLARVAVTADENAALRASLVELSSRLQFYNETAEENRRLRTLLGFVPPYNFRIVPAEIVGVSGSGIPNMVLVNLGADDSIQVNQPVIDRHGLAGRVAQVMDDYSVVYLLTEPRCRAAARVARSREQGIIRYSMARGLYLDNLPQRGDVMIGDTVVTSGLGGIFPEGLVIGTVISVEAPERQFFYNIGIDPAVNFNGLDELYVLAQER